MPRYYSHFDLWIILILHQVLEQVVLCNRSGLKDELDFMLKLVQKAEYEGQYKRQVIVLLCIGGLLAEGNFEVKVTI